jgi:hypothetical protein
LREGKLVRRPFEATVDELLADLDAFVDATHADLESSFLILPRGPHFVDYPAFQEAYECLKRETRGFQEFTPEVLWSAIVADGLVFAVIRTILGLTPPEWAELATSETGERVTQGQARSLDRAARVRRSYFRDLRGSRSRTTIARSRAMLVAACSHLLAPVPAGAADTVHRLDKVDTAQGLASVRRAAALHVPYAVLLYERFLGRPYAGHRDAVSELVGEAMEQAIEHRLQSADVSFRKTKRAERVPGFDQAPDFMVPDEIAPRVVIEAKLTNDDGTARDKFTRIIHLVELNRTRVAQGHPDYQVVACIDGRGFGVRREDMRRLLRSVEGKVFTLRTLDHLVASTRLAGFAVRRHDDQDSKP